ncbi:MAG: threonine synthase [Ferrovibrio sp.]|uniref:threonine synthase n=1 Tax=Ferrovibrio sp. TaxID=1917215 RepID=UPI002628922D|nr:threonine synthase [Ferrovibrio sp.]MCW0236372.1 threonine synthase [Ferrovibrio sp.]
MRYVSTRGQAPDLDFEGVLLAGLASDGGLYVPQSWPQFSVTDWRAMRGLPYAEVAFRVIKPFIGGGIPDADLKQMIAEAYGTFGHKAVVPLRQSDANDWVLELFHGPTLAFKDVALQLLGRLFDWALARSGKRATIVGATSGDTGSAAIEGCRGRANLDIFILFPHGRVSDVQRRQMTTVADANVHAIALEGTFDDAQAMVKALFNDAPFRDTVGLTAVNSINWARVMAQIVYYVTASLSLGGPERAPAFCVPSGNFGDIFAGYAAAKMGLPIARLVVATNRNDILARFFASGDYRKSGVESTISPSMDIQVASNFERLLFDMHGRDGAQIRQLMTDLDRNGGFTVSANALAETKQLFAAGKADEATTKAMLKTAFVAGNGLLVDPHTAVGLAVAAQQRQTGAIPPETALITLATADAAKFPDAVEAATGRHPALPPHLADLFERPERQTVLANDYGTVRNFIETRRVKA